MLNVEEVNISQMAHTVSSSTETKASLIGQGDEHVRQSSENGPVLNEDAEHSQARTLDDQQPLPHRPSPPRPTFQEQWPQDSRVLASDHQSIFWDQPVKADTNVDAHRDPAFVGNGQVHHEEPLFCSTSQLPIAEVAGFKEEASTSMEGLFSDLQADSAQLLEVEAKCPRSPGSPAMPSSPVYVKEFMPKPKMASELGGYMPKVGLTTFAVVPQKTFKKLRQFEAEVTLEALSVVEKQELAARVMTAGNCQMETGQPQLEELCASAPSNDCREHNRSIIDSGDHSNIALTRSDFAPPVVPPADGKGCEPSPAFDGVIKTGPALEIKGKKIPPATKPKPSSFCLPQHKRAPGNCVTPATASNLSAGCGGSPDTELGQQGKKPPQEPSPETGFSHLPLPSRHSAELWKGEAGGSSWEGRETERECSPKIPRQAEAPAHQLPTGLNLEKLRRFTTPKPYTPASPSRFALAVSLAVERTQSLTRGPGLCAGSSEPSHTLAAQDVKVPPRSWEMESGDSEVDTETVLRAKVVPGSHGTGSALPAALTHANGRDPPFTDTAACSMEPNGPETD